MFAILQKILAVDQKIYLEKDRETENLELISTTSKIVFLFRCFQSMILKYNYQLLIANIINTYNLLIDIKANFYFKDSFKINIFNYF